MTADFNPWIKSAFEQLFICANTRTAAGILTDVSIMFNSFTKQSASNWFVGQTTFPLLIQSQQMLVFGLNEKSNQAMSPTSR